MVFCKGIMIYCETQHYSDIGTSLLKKKENCRSTTLGDDCIHHLILLFKPLLEITNTEDV